jgi:hypothetical protein
MDEKELHDQLSKHFEEVGAMTKGLNEDIDAFSTPDMRSLFEQGLPHLLSAVQHVNNALTEHKTGRYLRASSHLVSAHNSYIKLANVFHQAHPDTPLGLSFKNRAVTSGEAVNKYVQLAAENNIR